MKIKILSILSILFLSNIFSAQAAETVKIHATILVASNEGVDSTPINNEYRRQLIQLFSYSAYSQAGDYQVDLEKTERRFVELPDGYKLALILREIDDKRVEVRAAVLKGNQQYLDTVISILRPGVVFLGGPPAQNGTLIIVLETGF